MKHTLNSKRQYRPPPTRRLVANLAGVVSAACLVSTSQAQIGPEFKLHNRTPGGLDIHPKIVSLTTTQGMTLNWAGVKGPYQVEWTRELFSPDWKSMGAPTTGSSLGVTATEASGYFRIGIPAPQYTGSAVCNDCHADHHTSWAATRHASALNSLKAIGMGNNASCLPCHTVGYGMPNGFKSEALTPQLAGVQCESCHGPAAAHVADEGMTPGLRPVATMSSMMCGGCHTSAHHPTFDEWELSGHGKVTPEVASSMISGGAARIQACGACHTGAGRLSMLTGKPLPTGAESAEVGVTCSVCHDAHANTAHGAQLRNPTSSMTPYSYSTSTNTSLAAQYNPNVSLCGQCHNMRGAAYTDTSRPPHHSPQYNMLIGNGGIEVGTVPQSFHRTIGGQCSACHVQPESVANPTDQAPNYTGHRYEVSLAGCTECHEDAEATVAGMSAEIDGKIATLKTLLDTWATTKSPDTIRTKYGALAWEYNNAGQISNPTGTSTIKGPTTAEQTSANVPDAIKQARFNMYLVVHDQSKGAHNPKYTRFLLKVATDKVNALLAP